MRILERRWNGILYEGGFEDFSVNGEFHMEKQIQYKNEPIIECRKRLNMAYLLLKNPKMIEVIQKSNGHFFHGTNANALPNILKYGINSMKTSIENNIDVNTGEEKFRGEGKKRNFISLTDSLNEATIYANLEPQNSSPNSLLNFGVVIGASFEKMKDLKIPEYVISDLSEVGVFENLPLEHIKFLAVPDDKVEFVKKMVGEKDIEVVSMNIRDTFFKKPFIEKLKMLEPSEQNKEILTSPYQHILKKMLNQW